MFHFAGAYLHAIKYLWTRGWQTILPISPAVASPISASAARKVNNAVVVEKAGNGARGKAVLAELKSTG